jgi:hypothetical protein
MAVDPLSRAAHTIFLMKRQLIPLADYDHARNYPALTKTHQNISAITPRNVIFAANSQSKWMG